jgi:hypothetical protein
VHLRGLPVAIVDYGTELLDGWLAVASVDGTRVEIPFNGSARAVMASVVGRLVPRSSADRLSDPLELDALGLPDTGLVNLYRAAASRRPLSILAAHASLTLRANASLLDRLRGRAPRLSGLVLAESDSELVLLSRRSFVRQSPKPDVSSRETIIVRRHLSSVAAAVSESLEGVTEVTLKAGAARVVASVPTGSDALRALKRR